MKYKKIKSLNIALACMVVGVTTNIFATTGAFAEVRNVQANNKTTQAGSTVEFGPTYTASEFDKCVEKYKNAMKEGNVIGADIEKNKTNLKEMENALEKLKADNGKGDFVVYNLGDDVAEWQTKDGHYICAGMIDGNASFGTNEETPQGESTVEFGPTYTASEFEKCVEKYKNTMTENIQAGKIKGADIEKDKTNIKEMEDALEKLKADNGKGKFVIYNLGDDVAEWQTKDGHYICAGIVEGVVSFGTDETQK